MQATENARRVKDGVLSGANTLDEAEAAYTEQFTAEAEFFGKLKGVFIPPDQVRRRVDIAMSDLRRKYVRNNPSARKAEAEARAKARQEKVGAKVAEREAKARAKAQERQAKRDAEEKQRAALKKLKAAEEEAARGKLPLEELEAAAREALTLKHYADKSADNRVRQINSRMGKLRVILAERAMREAFEGVISGTYTLEEAEATAVRMHMTRAEIGGGRADEALARKRAAGEIAKLRQIAQKRAYEQEFKKNPLRHEAEQAEAMRRHFVAEAEDERLSSAARAVARLKADAAQAKLRGIEQGTKFMAAERRFKEALREAEMVAQMPSGKRSTGRDAEEALRAISEAAREYEEALKEADLEHSIADRVGSVRAKLISAEEKKVREERELEEQERRKKELERRKKEEEIARRERKLRAKQERKERKEREAKERKERKEREAKEREQRRLREEKEREAQLRLEAKEKRRLQKEREAAETYLRAEAERLKAEGKDEVCQYHFITSAGVPMAPLVKVCIDSSGAVSRAALRGVHPFTSGVLSMWSLLPVGTDDAMRSVLERFSRHLTTLPDAPGSNVLYALGGPPPFGIFIRPLDAHIQTLFSLLDPVRGTMSGEEQRRVARELAAELTQMLGAFARPRLPSSLLG